MSLCVHPDFFTSDELVSLTQEGDTTGFPHIRQKLAQVGIDFPENQKLPLRWFYGNTAPHVDVSQKDASRGQTYLFYVSVISASKEEPTLYVGDQTCPIRQGTFVSFEENLIHFTKHAEDTRRLILGPMNQRGECVGTPYYINYFSDSLLTSSFYATYYLEGEDQTFASIDDVIPVESRPTNAIFRGWIVAQVEYGENAVYQVNEVVPAGAVYNTQTYYAVYPSWQYPQQIRQMHFSDNSKIFYKPGSLAPGGIGTVRNNRHKAKHI
jgi:hypothetical protein